MQRDDHEVSWAAIPPPRPCHLMAWSDGISIIYIVNLLLLTNKCQQRSSTEYAQCCTQHHAHTGKYCQLFPPALTPIWQHISICPRKKFNGLFFQRTHGSIQATARQNCTTQFLRQFHVCSHITHKVHSRLRGHG